MKKNPDLNNLSYHKFRELAKNSSLSRYEKIGFYNHLRKNSEQKIFNDLLTKLPNLNKKKQTIVDIGCGCSNLPFILIEYCKKNNHKLVLIDSPEMLNHLPDKSFITKIPHQFPNECNDFIYHYKEKVNVILSYSVFHYVFEEMPYLSFIDKSLELLAPQGQFLLGDLPNFTKQKRFFSSEAGIKYHQRNNKTKQKPVVNFNSISLNTIDDSVVFSILQRARLAGFESYLLPQADALTMSNRREDILITKH